MQIRVRIEVPDSWSEDDCDTFAASVKKDAEKLAVNVNAVRTQLANEYEAPRSIN